jgi:hypothetical protein
MSAVIELCNKLDNDIKNYIIEINNNIKSNDKTSLNEKITTLVKITYCRVQLIEIRKEIEKLVLDSKFNEITSAKAIESIKEVEDYVYSIIDNTNRLSLESLVESHDKIKSMLDIANSIKELILIDNQILSEIGTLS